MNKIALVFCIIPAFFLTACGSLGGSAQTENTSGTQTNISDMEERSSETQESSSADGKTLVVYYSSTGNTRAAAEYIASATGGDIFEIIPAEPYSADDLDWTNDNSRVSLEHEDQSLRNVELEASVPENWKDYDTVFIGYPIWWGIAAWPVDTFIKANDFSDKTVIPFCTSASSELVESGELLAEMAGTRIWLPGERFAQNVSEEEITEWISSLNLGYAD